MSTRDHASEMNALVQARITASGSYQSATVAAEIISDLNENDPDLLRGWLALHAHELLRNAINRVSQGQRARNRVMSGRKTFGEALRKYEETGEDGILTTWLSTPYVVDEGNLRMNLGDMRRADLNFASGYYQKLADANALEAQFLAALAKKVGHDKVSDHFTEEQLGAMRASLAKFFNNAPARTA